MTDEESVAPTPSPPAAPAAAPPAEPSAPADSGIVAAATRGAADAAAAAEAAAGLSRTADLMAGPGGVMTDEEGVVTGELTLRTELSAGTVRLSVQYKDADEWYAVTGGTAPLADPADLDAVHTIALALLHRPEG